MTSEALVHRFVIVCFGTVAEAWTDVLANPILHRSKFLSSSGAQGTLKNPIVAGLEKDSNTLSSGRSTPIRLEESGE